ncbi:MAG: hypothetical protein WBW33_32530 [Bryobacteraceae bacterium]
MNSRAHTVEGGCLPGFDTCSIVLEKGAVQSDGLLAPDSQDRHGQDYAASRSAQPLAGLAATLSIRHSPALGIAAKVMRREARDAKPFRIVFDDVPTTRSVTPSPQYLPARQTQRKIFPLEIPAAVAH